MIYFYKLGLERKLCNEPAQQTSIRSWYDREQPFGLRPDHYDRIWGNFDPDPGAGVDCGSGIL